MLLGSGSDPAAVPRFRSHKATALLAYLALAMGRECSRETLIETFWPDLEPAAARDNLSTTLSAIRRQVEPAGTPAGAVLRAERHVVAVNPETVTTDAADFERLLAQASRFPITQAGQRAALLEAAATLYRGDLLPGFYEEWALSEQARLAERYVEALEDLAEAHEAQGRPDEALATARRAAAADPLREAPRRAIMRLFAARGDVSGAREAYAAFEKLLKTEMGAAPDPETRRLAESIRRDPAAFARPSAISRALATEESAAPSSRSSAKLPPSSLPLLLTRFFGRERELDTLGRLLAEPEGPRVITLLGPGGSGKTRLAIEAARRDGEGRGGGVWFASLAELPLAALVPGAVAAALGIPPSRGRGDTDSLEKAVEVLATLDSARCLLVLDNAEHLLIPPGRLASDGKGDLPPGAGLVALIRRLLAAAPGLRCLVTSRLPLRLTGEQQFPVAPLDLPGALESAAGLLRSPAAALYADRARLARPDFALTDGNAAAVAGLCRHLEGIPLALELAASRARLLPPGEMLRRMQESERGRIDLAAPRRDGPERHRSLRAAMTWSYDLLPARHQAIFRRLGVFRGGWTLELAESACAAIADTVAVEEALSDLEEHSLVHVDADGRFSMLEPLREFAEETLEAAGETEEARRGHAAAIRGLTDGLTKNSTGPEARIWLDRLDRERANLRTALDWLLRADGNPADTTTLLRVAVDSSSLWRVRGSRQEGIDWLRRTLAHPTLQGATISRAAVLFKYGGLLYGADDAGARRCQEEAVSICRTLDNRRFLGMLIGDLGISLERLGEENAAEAAYAESLAIAREVGNRHSEATAHLNLGSLTAGRNDICAARSHTQTALALYRELGDAGSIGLCLDNLGGFAAQDGDSEGAARLWREAVCEYARIGEVRERLGLIEWLAWHEGRCGRHECAARLMSAVQSLQKSLECPLPAAYLTEHAGIKDASRAALGLEAFANAWTAGERLSLDEVTALVLSASPD